MMLGLVASTLVLVVVACGAIGLRAAIRLAVLSRQRHGHLIHGAPIAGTPAWRAASILMRVMDDVEELISRDPELAGLRRTRNVCLTTAAVLVLPAAYCVAIVIGRLLTE